MRWKEGRLFVHGCVLGFNIPHSLPNAPFWPFFPPIDSLPAKNMEWFAGVSTCGLVSFDVDLASMASVVSLLQVRAVLSIEENPWVSTCLGSYLESLFGLCPILLH